MAEQEQSIIFHKPTPDDEKFFCGEEVSEYVVFQNETVGFIKKARFGPGWFLKIFGTKWQNAPGARYPQELDARTDFTYCKTKRKVEETVLRVMAERSALVPK